MVSMSLSTAGSPLAVLSNSSAFAYQPGMKTWMRVVDSAFALSSYSSILASGMAGERPAVCFSGSLLWTPVGKCLLTGLTFSLTCCSAAGQVSVILSLCMAQPRCS